MDKSNARLYPKLRTWFSLSGKNPGFLANTFSTSRIIGEVKKVKLPSHRGFSDSTHVVKKWIKSSLVIPQNNFARGLLDIFLLEVPRPTSQ